MDLDAEMLQWSQTVYGVAHSLQIANSVKMGNLTTLVESLIAAERWTSSSLGFVSSVPEREFTDGTIKLDGNSHEDVFATLSGNLSSMLFINLMVLADEWLAQVIRSAGTEPPNYLTAKAEWVKSRIGSRYTWAANGLLEMCAIRNALVHNGGIINQPALEILEKADIQSATLGHKIELSFGDLFRYRRALRTVLGEIQKL